MQAVRLAANNLVSPRIMEYLKKDVTSQFKTNLSALPVSNYLLKVVSGTC